MGLSESDRLPLHGMLSPIPWLPFPSDSLLSPPIRGVCPLPPPVVSACVPPSCSQVHSRVAQTADPQGEENVYLKSSSHLLDAKKAKAPGFRNGRAAVSCQAHHGQIVLVLVAVLVAILVAILDLILIAILVGIPAVYMPHEDPD